MSTELPTSRLDLPPACLLSQRCPGREASLGRPRPFRSLLLTSDRPLLEGKGKLVRTDQFPAGCWRDLISTNYEMKQRLRGGIMT
jgi:hypothetical protein